jgi:DNA-binding FadR family transcriptional regulator
VVEPFPGDAQQPGASGLFSGATVRRAKAQLNTLWKRWCSEKLQRERWIEVDMAWHEHIYEMSGIRS